MPDLVRVESTDALRRFRAALCKFAELAGAGLDEAEFEIQRLAHWIKQDQQLHWKRQLTHRTELVTRAKIALQRKEAQRTSLGARYSCVDEMKALAAAQRALEEARRKQVSVQRWSRQLEEEGYSLAALTQGLQIALQSDVPQALAQLDQMIAAIEAYAAPAAPQQQVSATPTLADELAAANEPGTMKRNVDAGSSVSLNVCQTLRARTPSRATRAGIPISALDPAPAGESPVYADVLAAVAACGLAEAPPDPGDKVVLARGALHATHVYLERAADEGEHDGGWYLGLVDEGAAVEFEAAAVGSVLVVRPAWAPLFSLPPGTLATLNGPALEAVYGPQDQLLWCAR